VNAHATPLPEAAAESQAAVGSRPTYEVRPSLGKWEVVIGDSGARFVYATRDDAMQVARGAARLHWATRHEPCDATLQDEDGAVCMLARYGT
jgi:hypothetical protein